MRATWCSAAVMVVGPMIAVYAIYDAIYEMQETHGKTSGSAILLLIVFCRYPTGDYLGGLLIRWVGAVLACGR